LFSFLDVLFELVQNLVDRFHIVEVTLPAVVLLKVFVDVVLVAERNKKPVK
jgi:hypothetical protein